MGINYTRKSASEDDTRTIAKEFSDCITNGMVITLIGNLGAGKTFFIKALLEQFGIENANSPTFALVNEYVGKKKFYHFDFYRINKESELIDIGLEDYLQDDDAICLIEWADLFPQVLPAKRIEIVITVNDDYSRYFEIKEHE